MKELIEQKTVLFHNRARAILLHLSDEFRQATSPLDRQWDENVFQLQQAKHTNRLQHQLQTIAHEIVNNITEENSRHSVQLALMNLVAYYLHEFQQKTRSL